MPNCTHLILYRANHNAQVLLHQSILGHQLLNRVILTVAVRIRTCKHNALDLLDEVHFVVDVVLNIAIIIVRRRFSKVLDLYKRSLFAYIFQVREHFSVVKSFTLDIWAVSSRILTLRPIWRVSEGHNLTFTVLAACVAISRQIVRRVAWLKIERVFAASV